jgi:single-strand selective monofunctional uracil DNA glycosylase
MSQDLHAITRDLVRGVERLRFGPPVAHVYNPLRYAAKPHRLYLERYGRGPREVLLVGMNPGPWGMGQTGIPFGAVGMVRDWLGIEGAVARPRREHPERPVLGFACRREEGSGRRLWGWACDHFGDARRFFERFFVLNYCPLLFYDRKGHNLTPDRLRAADREALFVPCDRALRRFAEAFRARVVVGVGAFAEGRAREALAGLDTAVGRIPHPSPANPAANRGWDEMATKGLRALGVAVPEPRFSTQRKPGSLS